MSTEGSKALFGLFTIGDVQLGLPLGVILQALPGGDMNPLASDNALVVGGISFQGAVLPIVDLRTALQLPDGSALETIVIMSHAGILIGVLADRVDGVTGCGQSRYTRLGMNDSMGLLEGGFQHSDSDCLVNILSPERLVAAVVADRCSSDEGGSHNSAPDCGAGQRNATVDGDTAARMPASRHLVLVKSGQFPFAIDSRAVQTTLLDPQIFPSELTGGYCLGVVEYQGNHIPAVDVLQLLGIGRFDQQSTQAFLVRFEGGLLALVVNLIIDVVRADAECGVDIPSNVIAEQRFLRSLVPLQQLPTHNVDSRVRELQYYMELDAGNLLADSLLSGLSRLVTPLHAQQEPAQPGCAEAAEAAGAARRQRIITFSLGAGELAVPLEQVAEILPWSEASDAFGGLDAAVGLILSRDRVIPVYLLADQLEVTGQPLDSQSSILLVAHAGVLIGYAVNRLVSMEEAYAHELEKHLWSGRSGQQPGNRWRPVSVISASSRRLVEAIDLLAFAARRPVLSAQHAALCPPAASAVSARPTADLQRRAG